MAAHTKMAPYTAVASQLRLSVSPWQVSDTIFSALLTVALSQPSTLQADFSSQSLTIGMSDVLGSCAEVSVIL